MIRVFIADDHEMFLEGLTALINSFDNVEVVKTVDNGETAIDFLKHNEVEVALLDISMPQKNGIEVIEALSDSTVKKVVLSMHNDRTTIEKAMRAGADGYLLKNSTREQLLSAINAVVQGQNYYVDEVKDILINTFRSSSVSQEVRLTPRELDVLKYICQELTTAQIASKLHVAVNTVETHRKNLLSKVGAKNSIGLVKFAMEQDLF